ncbi:MAG: hypothetical protein EPN43_08815 [Jatrophihabitans sp.]|nr:MAG: hypothetical protein EPN43_08815 [Jatrophihabitans sp.]
MTAAATARAQVFALRPAPRREPPFDDEIGLRLVGPHDRRLPFGRERKRPTPPPEQAPARSTLPDPARWSHRLLLGVLESAAGRRPLQQITALLSPAVAAGLREDFDRAQRRRRPHWAHAAAVRSVHASEPAAGVAEICATLQTGRRVRAVALRLEARGGQWRCTRLQVG